MTTFAPRRHDRLTREALDERTRQAWGAYRDSLAELTGQEYEDAEHRRWHLLQRELAKIEAERAELDGRSPAPTR
jgi:hypothetical protein